MSDTVDLPADVDAFVATIEYYVEKGDGGADEKDTLELCGIIRKQAAELAHWQRVSGCANPETISAVIADFYKCAECQPPLDGIPDGIDRIKKERNGLRERLAKLESAARDALNLFGPEYFDDGKPLEELGRLVNIKGAS